MHCAYPNLVQCMLAAPVEVHETNWKCLHSSAAGLPEPLHSYLHFFLILEFPHLCYLILNLLADVDSCDEDDDDADEGVVEEELADIPGTTNGT